MMDIKANNETVALAGEEMENVIGGLNAMPSRRPRQYHCSACNTSFSATGDAERNPCPHCRATGTVKRA